MPHPWEALFSTAAGTRSQLVGWTLYPEAYDNPLGFPTDDWMHCEVWAGGLLACLRKGEAALSGDPVHQEARRVWEKERGPAHPQSEWRVVGSIIPDTTAGAGIEEQIRVAGGDPADESNTARFALSAPTADLAALRTETMGRLDRHLKAYNPEGFQHEEWWKWKLILKEYAARVPQLSADLINDPVGTLDFDLQLCTNMIELLRRHITLTLAEKQYLIKERPTTATPEAGARAWNGWGKARWRLWTQILMLSSELSTGVGKIAAELRGALVDRAYEGTRLAATEAEASPEELLEQHPFDDVEFLGWRIRDQVQGSDPNLFQRTATMTPTELEAAAKGLGMNPGIASDADRARYILAYSVADEMRRAQARKADGPVMGTAPTAHQMRLHRLQSELRGANDDKALELLLQCGLSLPASS
ncbi:MAG: hypothetical protein WEE36_06055 [Acidimicrobiia bacterium]